MKVLRRITFIAAFLAVTMSVNAQSRIDAYLDRLEKKSDVQCIYTEYRDPETKELTRISRIISFDNEAYVKRLVRAFEEERENALKATKTKGTDGESGYCYIYSFRSSDGKTISYVFSFNGGAGNVVMSNKSEFSIDFKSLDGKKQPKKKKKRRKSRTGNAESRSDSHIVIDSVGEIVTCYSDGCPVAGM